MTSDNLGRVSSQLGFILSLPCPDPWQICAPNPPSSTQHSLHNCVDHLAALFYVHATLLSESDLWWSLSTIQGITFCYIQRPEVFAMISLSHHKFPIIAKHTFHSIRITLSYLELNGQNAWKWQMIVAKLSITLYVSINENLLLKKVQKEVLIFFSVLHQECKQCNILYSQKTMLGSDDIADKKLLQKMKMQHMNSQRDLFSNFNEKHFVCIVGHNKEKHSPWNYFSWKKFFWESKRSS